MTSGLVQGVQDRGVQVVQVAALDRGAPGSQGPSAPVPLDEDEDRDASTCSVGL